MKVRSLPLSFKPKHAYTRGIALLGALMVVSSFVLAEAETISLDLKGMDVVEVLKTLASKGNMNLVVGSNVRGRVTMFLKDVDINDAFDIILAANNLAIDKQGDIIYVMPERDYELLYGEKYGDKKEAKIIQLKYAKAVEVQKALNQIKTKIGKIIIDEGSNTIVIIDSAKVAEQAVLLVEKIDRPTETLIIELNYAVVADLKEKIESVLTKGVGTVQIDDRTNKIFITDLKENIPKISEMVSAFDSRLQQVLIDARIMEISLNDEFKLGVDWEVVTDVFQDLLKKDVGIKSNFGLGAAGTFIPGGEIIIGAFGVGDYAA
ncbi:MAG: secretin N-terminal domain-containing protein, partial [Candidatus Omnitrophota bacterium]